jgi:hypothetical protein
MSSNRPTRPSKRFQGYRNEDWWCSHDCTTEIKVRVRKWESGTGWYDQSSSSQNSMNNIFHNSSIHHLIVVFVVVVNVRIVVLNEDAMKYPWILLLLVFFNPLLYLVSSLLVVVLFTHSKLDRHSPWKTRFAWRHSKISKNDFISFKSKISFWLTVKSFFYREIYARFFKGFNGILLVG